MLSSVLKLVKTVLVSITNGDDKLQYITWLYMVLCTGVTKTIFGLNRNLFEGDY